MIPFTFEYHQPATLKEAVDAFFELDREGLDPVYYGGGTEILTRSRLNQMKPGALIDIKAIPELGRLETQGERVHLGAGLTLAQLSDAGLWPLMSDVAGRVADHTTRCQITLGGNIAGTIHYREALLPLLLADASAVVVGQGGKTKEVPLASIFDRTLNLGPGELLVSLSIPAPAAKYPHAAMKRTRLDWVDYPLLTVAAHHDGDQVRVAFSGLCSFPFRDNRIEQSLGDTRRNRADRIKEALSRLPEEPPSDIHGSSAYRRFMFEKTVDTILDQLEA